MRTYLRAATLALTITMLAASGAAAQGPQKFGYIDSRQVLQQAPGRASIEAQLKTQQDAFQKRLGVMQDSMRTLLTAFQNEQAALTPAVRTQRQDALEKKQEAFAREAQDLEQKFADARDALSRPLMEMFNRVLNEVRAEDGYAFIFDVGSDAQVIVAADKNLDVTEKVIARMRTAAAAKPAATPTRPAAGGPVQSPTGVKPPPAR